MTLPLSGIRIVDFSTLLPGPLATLMLSEVGADVLKIERPGGEDMRQFPPAHGASSAPFMALNGGKRSEALDLKTQAGVARAFSLASAADVLVEQFRPGVMDRLGLGYATLSAVNPRLIYCSITGHGQSGPRAAQAGHDLNYQALSGVLAQGLERGRPAPLPPALIADIAGGAYPAVMNILLALRQRDVTGLGCHLDIAMTEGATTFALFGDTAAAATGTAPAGGGALLTGGSPRYRLYATRDGWFLAVGALEDKFWTTFCAAAGLPREVSTGDMPDHEALMVVADVIASRDAGYWRALLEPLDCCCTVVRTLDEARAERLIRQPVARDLSGTTVPLAVIPINPGFRRSVEDNRQVPPLNGSEG